MSSRALWAAGALFVAVVIGATDAGWAGPGEEPPPTTTPPTTTPPPTTPPTTVPPTAPPPVPFPEVPPPELPPGEPEPEVLVPPPDDANLARVQVRLQRARRRAYEATLDFQAALSEQGRLEAEYAATTAQISSTRLRVRQIQDDLDARAAARYRGQGPTTVMEVVDTDGPLDAQRATKVITDLAERDQKILDRFEGENDDLDELLDAQQTNLKAQREVVEKLDDVRQRLELELASATSAYRALSGQPWDGPQVIVNGDAVCPIQAPVTFTDDWHNPRSGGRLHEGNDIFADPGSPNVAVVDGEMRQTSGGLGGNGVWIDGEDGNSYYYAHLSAWEGPSRHVVKGEIVGYTGNTGNAAGGAHHTHFEIHPGGGEPINPYPTLSVICAKERGRVAEGE